MNPWRLPAKRWSILQHMLLASLLVSGVVAGGWTWDHASRKTELASRAELLELRGQLSSTRYASASPSFVDFAQSLPSGRRSDNVVQEISRSAQTLGVQVLSLSVEPRGATITELGRVQFNLVANAQYRAVKTWIAELLGRYPSLGVASLSMHNSANDPSRLDISLSMVLVVKD